MQSIDEITQLRGTHSSHKMRDEIPRTLNESFFLHTCSNRSLKFPPKFDYPNIVLPSLINERRGKKIREILKISIL